MQQVIDKARGANIRSAGDGRADDGAPCKGVVQLLAASANANFADKIAAALLRAGYRLDPGEFDPDRIDAVVVLWTGVALDKPEMIAVARSAWKAGKLAPVSIGRIEPPFAARDAAPMDLAGWRGDDEDPRWRFVLSDLESIKIRQRVAGPVDVPLVAPVKASADDSAEPASGGMADTTALSAGDLAAGAVAANEPLRVHHPARHLWRNHIRPSAAPFMAGMAVVSAAGWAAFSLGAHNDKVVLTAPAAQEVAEAMPDQALTPGAGTAPAKPSLRELADASILAQEPSVDGSKQADEPPSDSKLSFVRPADTMETETPTETPTGEVETSEATEDDVAEIAPPAAEEGSSRVAMLAPNLKPRVSTPMESLTEEGLETADAAEAAAITENPPGEALAASLISDGVLADALLTPDNPPTEEAQIPAGQAGQPVTSDTLNQQRLDLLAAQSGQTGGRTQTAAKTTAYRGDYFSDCVGCPDMAALDGGGFAMGAAAGEAGAEPAERPQRWVYIGYRFAIATRETTFDQWSACVADGGCQAYAPADSGLGRGDRPVINVSYEDASAYARWLSAKTGKYYRLPSEAEWEFAARAGREEPYAFGARLNTDQANIAGVRGGTVAVTSFAPNGFGIFDMHGNVWEWTSDCWTASHHGGPATGAARIDGDCSRRVIKGGAWNSPAKDARSAHREALGQMAQRNDAGFRVVRVLD